MTVRPKSGSRLRIVVTGYSVRWPVGGMAWHYLNYVLSAAALGHDVCFFEESGDYPSCWNSATESMQQSPASGLDFTATAFASIDHADRWGYFDEHTNRWLGPRGTGMLEYLNTADVLINVSGVTDISERTASIPVRILIDTDPVFTQIKHLTNPKRLERARSHNSFFTFGKKFGSSSCSIPDDGLPWEPTHQPIALDSWKVANDAPRSGFTTVMQWNSYATAEYRGRRYGLKSDEFDPYFDVPKHTSANLEIAVSRLPERYRDRLRSADWSVVDGAEVSRDTRTYQDYVSSSLGEFTVAKHGYVATRSGWFSERSACYLASGRPVVSQDTGFSDWLPTGVGLCTFANVDEAAAALADVANRYEAHRRAAREIAQEFFHPRRALSPMLDRATASSLQPESP